MCPNPPKPCQAGLAVLMIHLTETEAPRSLSCQKTEPAVRPLRSATRHMPPMPAPWGPFLGKAELG